MENKAKNSFTVKLDYRLIILVLLLVIAGMLALWRPWSSPADTGRTISVTGETKLEAEPDEFVFYPSYQFKNTDKAAALAEVSAKSTEITNKLKELGVAPAKIKSDSSGYNYNYYFNPEDDTTTYTLQLTVKASSKEQAQKVQDYLVTTSPEGQVTPQANFSDTLRDQLESKGRDEATKDARAKAEQSAKNLGFKVGKVKSVEDSSNDMGGIYPLASGVAMDSAGGSETKSSLAIQPGENELRYSVTVVYFVR
jgi:uncharacterized protein